MLQEAFFIAKWIMARDIEKERARKKAYHLARKAGDEKFAPLKKIRMQAIPTIKDRNGLWIKCVTIGDVQYRTVSYDRWKAIGARCRNGVHVHAGSPTYLDCEKHPDFIDYQKFADWHTSQVGYDVEGYHVDKDILVSGNRIYGPETCVLVPQELNSSFTNWPDRDLLPRGVRHDKARIKGYRAEITINNKVVHLGRFYSAEEASNSYQVARREQIKNWILRLESGEFVIDPRVINALKRMLNV